MRTFPYSAVLSLLLAFAGPVPPRPTGPAASPLLLAARDPGPVAPDLPGRVTTRGVFAHPGMIADGTPDEFGVWRYDPATLRPFGPPVGSPLRVTRALTIPGWEGDGTLDADGTWHYIIGSARPIATPPVVNPLNVIPPLTPVPSRPLIYWPAASCPTGTCPSPALRGW